MQPKYPIIIFLFYLLAVLQNTFFARFNLFSVIPNFVFTFFFLLVFFSEIKEALFGALIAGFFTDLFSSSRFGIFILLFVAIGFLAKKMQSLLKEKKDAYPLFYFLALFLFWFIIYELLFLVGGGMFLAKKFVLETASNLLLASFAFYIFKFFIIGKKWQRPTS
jgi:rod shape-determining protein MreD